MTENLKIEPFVFIVFGGTGDLMKRKLLPSLYRLSREITEGIPFHILGVARKSMSADAYHQWVCEALMEAGVTEPSQEWCQQNISYHSLSGNHEETFYQLKKVINDIEERKGIPGNRVFYLAIPPSAYPEVIRRLGESECQVSTGWNRLVVEKPFGYNLSSAQELNNLIHRYFREDQVYRIDHYLGKETVQNLFIFRFANLLFESIWNRQLIQSVHITVAEDLGVEGRAGYYDRTGALRDMVQNHLTQILTLIAMEPPVAYRPDAVRFEKVKVLQAIRPVLKEDVIFGQYTAGVLKGERVRGYREEDGVAPDSRTETFVAMRLWLDTWRWQGVPFYIRTGKRMPEKKTQIVIRFRQPPVCLFESMGKCLVHSNTLEILLQPDEGFRLYFDIKEPGEPLRLRPLPLDFYYHEVFQALPDAYETLLLDVLMGDATLFVHADEVEASWRIYDPLLREDIRIYPYPAGTEGPSEAQLWFPPVVDRDEPGG